MSHPDTEYQYRNKCPYGCEPMRIAMIIQRQGGSDSGGVYDVVLNIEQIYMTPDGLVVRVS